VRVARRGLGGAALIVVVLIPLAGARSAPRQVEVEFRADDARPVEGGEVRQAERDPKLARPDSAPASELERVRVAIDRLAAAQRRLARRLDDRLLSTPATQDPETDGTPGLAPLMLVIGGVIGWTMSRLVQRRRDSRQRSRLQL
jgi:hypothetical protein